MSTVGAEPLAPRYLSSKESYEAAAAAAELAAAVALDAAAVALAAASATLVVKLTPATVSPVAVSIPQLLIASPSISKACCMVLVSPEVLFLYNTLFWNSASIKSYAELNAVLLAYPAAMVGSVILAIYVFLDFLLDSFFRLVLAETFLRLDFLLFFGLLSLWST